MLTIECEQKGKGLFNARLHLLYAHLRDAKTILFKETNIPLFYVLFFMGKGFISNCYYQMIDD